MKCFQVIDLLVKLLQCALKEGDEEPHMIRIFKEAYDVLHAYMIGKSRKNALYFAKYIDFFQTQFTQKVTQSERHPDKNYQKKKKHLQRSLYGPYKGPMIILPQQVFDPAPYHNSIVSS